MTQINEVRGTSEAAEGVREFHEFFGFPTRNVPEVIEGTELGLRKTLLEEEHAELQEALDEGDLEQIAKEAADLLYVLYGLQWHVGLDFDRAFAEVHRANMTKLWECERCEGTGDRFGRAYATGNKVDCPACAGAGKLGKYRADGKVLKPADYEKADLSYINEEREWALT